MNETYKLIWVGPIVSQSVMEDLFSYINQHLSDLQLKPLLSFQKMKVEFLNEPSESLRCEFEVVSLDVPHSVEMLKEAVWSEVLASALPVPSPYALALLPHDTTTTPKKLICFDMDSTLINEEVIDEIARSAGLYDQVAEITESAMQGKLDFKAALRARTRLFQSLPRAQAESIIPSLSLSPGASELLKGLRTHQIKTAVLSGGFEFVLKHFQKQLFIDQVYGNVLGYDDEERLTGAVEDPVVDAEYKKKLVAQLKSNYAVTERETVVVGDGANDISMMSEAGVSVSFCGKASLSAQTNTLILDRNLLWLKAFL